VRVFLPTYRRPTLLPRAVASLRAQTMHDWVCELHNDDPADSFPAELVRQLGDPRIRLVQHPRNLGPIETFNLFYTPTAEPFYALLEDDNTWEPDFLDTLLSALSAQPQATLAWCNQRVVREDSAGGLHETGTCVRPLEEADPSPRLQPWGDPAQLMGALHANGAMLIRSRPGETYRTPAIPFGCVEAFRERMLPHPLVYVSEPLATFTITTQTARQHDLRNWGAAQALLTATYVRHTRFDAAALDALCARSRGQKPPTIPVLIAATFLCAEARPLRRHLRLSDWLYFLKNALRHPQNTWHTLRARTRHPDWWDLLDRHTAARFREAEAANPARAH
jgi:hypothetical protein